MDAKLQELTDKIYNEGVAKGKIEAAEIVSKAEAKAAEIVAQAQAEAKKTQAEAERKAVELDQNTRSELKLFAAQSVNALKTEITNLLCNRLATDSVKAATADKTFMQKIIADIVAQWLQNGTATIETKDAKALETYFAGNAKDLLNKGLKIKEVNGVKSDFVITSATDGYKVTFGDAEFIEYFKEFLRPKLVAMLF